MITSVPSQPAVGPSVPQRTCVACRQVLAKRQLVRIVRTPSGRVELDATGKGAGRGAYLCPRRSCWEEAVRRRRLQRALKTPLAEEDAAALRDFANSLSDEVRP